MTPVIPVAWQLLVVLIAPVSVIAAAVLVFVLHRRLPLAWRRLPAAAAPGADDPRQDEGA